MATTTKLDKDKVVSLGGTEYNAAGDILPQLLTFSDWNNTLVSENHPGWNTATMLEDRGGPFSITKREINRYPTDPFEVNYWPGSGTLGKAGYRGVGVNAHTPVNPAASPINFDYWGPIAYKRMKPTKPSFNAITSIAELRDIPNMLKQRFTRNIQGAANSHLAIQFGWLPLIDDVRKLVRAQMGLQARLAWLIKNEGKPIRTRVHLNTYSNVSDSTYTVKNPYLLAFQGPIVSRYSAGIPWVRREWSTETVLVWASAQWRFWLPTGPRDIYWNREMKRRIFGLYVSPAQVYSAVPWSWLIDWFSNVGDVLENLEGGLADRCAATRFYVMGTQTRINHSELSLTIRDSDWGDQQAVIAHTENALITKTRVRGDPFGFNTALNSLTPMQTSILGALGLSRLR